jgi:hypothetical protein
VAPFALGVVIFTCRYSQWLKTRIGKFSFGVAIIKVHFINECRLSAVLVHAMSCK